MEIFLYSFSVMYSPGPVNAMGLNAGLVGQFRQTAGFFLGVGFAMFVLFILFGYTGEALISKAILPYLTLIGAGYTSYLAYKVYTSKVSFPDRAEGVAETELKTLTFWNGFLIQALNPKGMMVVLPVATVMFPAAQITGIFIVGVSALIAIAGAGAPAIYSLLGALVGSRITKSSHFDTFNRLMGFILAICACFMFYDFFLHFHKG